MKRKSFLPKFQNNTFRVLVHGAGFDVVDQYGIVIASGQEQLSVIGKACARKRKRKSVKFSGNACTTVARFQ